MSRAGASARSMRRCKAHAVARRVPRAGHPHSGGENRPSRGQESPENFRTSWYNHLMQPLDKRILDLLRGPAPPQGPLELLKQCGAAHKAVMYSRLSMLLREGVIKQDDIPWRKGLPPSQKGRARGVPKAFKDIARAAKRIVEDDGNDRVSALRLLADLRQATEDVSGPPPPEDIAGQTDALERIMLAAGPVITSIALARAWPKGIPTMEAIPNGKAAQEAGNSDGPAAGGSNLD